MNKSYILREVEKVSYEEVIKELAELTETKERTIESKDREIKLLWAAVNLLALDK